MIRQDSKPDSFDESRAREDYVFQGYKNSLMYLRRYYAEYHCTFNLRFFPFDEQVCKMEFKASNTNMTTAREHTTRSEIRIVINLARQYTYHLSQSFFQSWLLGFLAYLTFWININDFTDRFMGSLTALLVLASL